jgi:hypothetical protein
MVGRKQDRKPISPYEVWQLHMKKQFLCDWTHETWMSTASYSGTERPIDGLIMYVILTSPYSVQAEMSQASQRMPRDSALGRVGEDSLGAVVGLCRYRSHPRHDLRGFPHRSPTGSSGRCPC